MSRAVIAGAGVAGLAAAIRLRMQGFEVDVYEKNSYPGGKLSAFETSGYRFDAGPSLFTQPHLIEELFALAGEPVEDYITYERVPLTCTYFYEDGTQVNAYADHEKFAQELTEKLGERPGALRDYLDRSRIMYEKIGRVFLGNSLHKRATLLHRDTWQALRAARLPYLFRSMHALNAAHFNDPRTVQLFDRYATYNGSDPYRAPGMLGLIPHVEHNEGVFYPKGGMISITNALHRLAEKKGVRFHFDAPVQKIIRHERRVQGVVVNGENVPADIVVSNLDVYFTYRQLLNDESRAHRLSKQERSSSALIFYWGIRHSFPQLGLHNIFFSKNYRSEFDHLFRRRKAFNDPTLYLNITSKYEPGVHAPSGSENWFVMVNAPSDAGQDWNAFRHTYRAAALAKLGRALGTDIEPLIETEEVLDPLLIASRTGSFKGALYGTSSNSRMAAFVRHANFSKSIDGLYFVGGSVHPGGGIPLCLQSADIMSRLVRQDQNKRKH